MANRRRDQPSGVSAPDLSLVRSERFGRQATRSRAGARSISRTPLQALRDRLSSRVPTPTFGSSDRASSSCREPADRRDVFAPDR